MPNQPISPQMAQAMMAAQARKRMPQQGQMRRPMPPQMAAQAMPPQMVGRGMKEGGITDTAQDKAMIMKAFKQHDAQEHKGGKGTKLKLKGGGYVSAADGCATKGKTKGKFV